MNPTPMAGSATRFLYRKKGVLLLYKVFLRYPDSLRPAFPRLKEKLEDPDPGVQVADSVPKLNYNTYLECLFQIIT